MTNLGRVLRICWSKARGRRNIRASKAISSLYRVVTNCPMPGPLECKTIVKTCKVRILVVMMIQVKCKSKAKAIVSQATISKE